MQRPENEVAGFGGFDRDRNGIEIAHFADEQDIRVLAECGTQRVLERIGVVVDLSLIDEAFLVFVDKFDRVLDRDDMVLAPLVYLIDHRAQRRRFAGTGRTGHDHKPFLSSIG